MEKKVKKPATKRQAVKKDEVVNIQGSKVPENATAQKPTTLGKGMESLENFQGDKSNEGQLKATTNKLKGITVGVTPEQVSEKMRSIKENEEEIERIAQEVGPLMKDEKTVEAAQRYTENVFGTTEATINEMPEAEKVKAAVAWIKNLCYKLPDNKIAKGWIARTAINLGMAKPSAYADPKATKLPVHEGDHWATKPYELVGGVEVYIKDKFDAIRQLEQDEQSKAVNDAKEGTVSFLRALESGGRTIISVPGDERHASGKMEIEVKDGHVHPTGKGFYGSVGFAKMLDDKKVKIAVADVATGKLNLQEKLPKDVFLAHVSFVRILNQAYQHIKVVKAEEEKAMAKANTEMKDLIKGTAVGFAKAYIPHWKDVKSGMECNGVKVLVEGNGKGQFRVAYTNYPKLFQNCTEFKDHAVYPLNAMFGLKK